MKPSFLQRGALLIVAVVLVLVITVLLLSLSFMAASNISSSGGHLSSAQALYIAESGIESALQRLHRPGFSCTSGVAETQSLQTLVGQGSYTTIGTAYNPAVSGNTITSAMNAVGTIIPVSALTGFAPHGRVLIEFEEIDYSSSSISATVCGTAPCLTGAKRGAAGTVPAPHAVGVGVNQKLCLIRSTGTADSAQRVVERTVHSPDAMIVYSRAAAAAVGVTDTPFYRIWDQGTSSWPLVDSAATPVTAGTQIRHMVIKFARTRNEAILGTLDSGGDIRVQVWNGFVWGPTQLLANVGGANSAFRGFDISYETENDRAIVVYNNANNRNPAYRIWNGGPAWSAAVTLNTEIGVYPINSPPIWIDLARNPLRGSNEIVLITQSLNNAVFGVRWNGTQWNTMPPTGLATWDASVTDGSDRMAIGVAYEQLSGRAFFVWADNTVRQIQYRIWGGTNITGNTALANILGAGLRGQWMRVVAQPNSNNLMFGVQDSGADLRTMFWNGAAWVTNTLHDPATEDVTNRNFDIVFETHPVNSGVGWVMWGNGAQTSRRRWAAGAWGGATTFSSRDNLVQLLAQPGTGAVFAALYEDTTAANPDELLALQLTGGSAAAWSGTQQIWPGNTAFSVNTRAFFGARGQVSIGRHEVYP